MPVVRTQCVVCASPNLERARLGHRLMPTPLYLKRAKFWSGPIMTDAILCMQCGHIELVAEPKDAQENLPAGPKTV
ncbi:hypothetical protein BH11PLA1_BH11PLA1_13020 [soil metagenome]